MTHDKFCRGHKQYMSSVTFVESQYPTFLSKEIGTTSCNCSYIQDIRSDEREKIKTRVQAIHKPETIGNLTLCSEGCHEEGFDSSGPYIVASDYPCLTVRAVEEEQ